MSKSFQDRRIEIEILVFLFETIFHITVAQLCLSELLQPFFLDFTILSKALA